jgi:dipeptidyl aminopeptidase/acylaminoacyl peptidase
MRNSTWLRWGSAVGTVLVVSFHLAGCRQTIGARSDQAAAPMTHAQAESRAAHFFSNATLSRPRLSPDGTHIAAMMAQGGTEVLIIRPTLGGAIRPVVKLERTRSKASYAVRRIGWAGNDRLLISVERPHSTPSGGGAGIRPRQTRLMSVKAEGGLPKYLGEDWPYQEWSQTQDHIIDWLPDEPNFVLIGLWAPDQNGVSVRRLNVIHGGLSTLVRARYGTTGWSADHRGAVRAGWGEPRSGSEEFVYARISEHHDWEEILRWDRFADSGGFWFAGFSERPEEIYVYRYSDEHNRLSLYRYDIEKRKLGPMVFGHPEYDIEDIRTAHDDGRLLRVYYQAERPMHEDRDPKSRAETAAFNRAMPNLNWRIIDSDQAERHVIIQTSSDVSPPRYFLYSRDTKKLLPLFSGYPGLEKRKFSKMEPVRYQARDGLEIAGYLTLPGTGEAPYPTIVHPHGGPWARDTWGWDEVVQYFASLGFAVFQPNFRGSDGYGGNFENRGRGEWGLSMQDDISDGTQWLIDQKIADPERIGIYGASYGGYAALWGLIKTPDLFKAGASFAGVTDLPTLLGDDAKYYSMVDEMEQLVGDRWTDRTRLVETSPARNADKIKVPVFIAHGTEDWRVHVRQAEMMADALEDAGVPVDVHLYRGEVHGFIDERNRIDFYDKLGAFFERHLMGERPAVASAEAGQAE